MKKKFRSTFALFLAVVMCALVMKPLEWRSVASVLATKQENKVHDAWKAEAGNTNVNLFCVDDNLYYTEPDAEDIVHLTDNLGYVNNELLIFFNEGTTVQEKQNVFESIGATVIGYTDVINQYQLRVQKQNLAELQALCTAVKKNNCVALASCNMAKVVMEDSVPDDPWTNKYGYKEIYDWDESDAYGGNWWLKVIQAPSAWEYDEYFHHIRIGIVDSGFETEHEDLVGKISFPSKFFQKTSFPSSHGTHVAGIISANRNNGIGVTGICDNADLLCVDWQPDKNEKQNWITGERILTGLIATVRGDAKVINFSLGSTGSMKEVNFSWKTSMFFEGVLFSYTIASLLSKGYDFIVVQSAGNGDKNNTPADAYYNGNFACITKKNTFTGLTGIKKQDVLDHIIIVGSVTSSHLGTKFYNSSYSNYGETVSIYAPGSSVFATGLISEGNYVYKSGTSMAAPVVTATAALTWSVNPKLTGAQVKKILCNPENSIYTSYNYYYKDDIEMPVRPIVNAKLCVEAAIATLDPSELPVPPDEGEKVESQKDLIPITDSTPIAEAEKFRFEVGE